MVKMKLGSLLDYLVTFFRTLFRAIDVFLNLPDWLICSYIFSRYLVCFKSNDSKCAWCSSLDGNTNSRNFFIDITSSSNRLYSWRMDGDFILVIKYDIQACTFGTVILFMDKNFLIRSYSNCLSLSSMLDESVSIWSCGWVHDVQMIRDW